MKRKKPAVNTKTEEVKDPAVKKKPEKRTSFLKSEKFRRISGLFLVLMSLILLFSFTSYLFTWKADDIILPEGEADNLIGRAGRAMSKFIIEQGFGIASYVFVLLLFVYGIRLLLKVSVLPVGKSTRISILALVWISIAIGFIFGQSGDLSILAGRFGVYINLWLAQAIGKIGTGILLLFILLSFLIINFDLTFNFLKELKIFQPKEISENKIANAPKVDLYNTAEHAVDDEDEDEDDDEDDDFIKPPEQPKFSEPLIIVEPGAEKEETDYANPEPEFTIETPIATVEKEVEIRERADEPIDHKTIDEPYDPRLDLATYKFPTLDLLENYGRDQITVHKEELEVNKNRIVETLNNYSIQIQKIKATIGPTVTLYEIIPAPGVRISRIKNLEDDIALSLSALGIRIIAPIPGKGTIGIEVPNQNPDIVSI
jgi:S-DNA-T family DNA segregation ATPase FtsK/SpoIIIE